jgi:TrmH family RNA methyltransferase
MQFKKIESKDNEKIKTLRKLQRKKYRNKLNLFCVENLTIILDALKAGNDFESIFVTDDFLKKNEEKMRVIFDESKDGNFFLITGEINKSFSSLDTPSGICAIYKKVDREIDFDESTIYLNGVSDPGNLGTIFRSALAFGFENVVLDEDCADVYNPKTIQASKGSIFHLKMSLDSERKIFEKIKSKMKIISTNVEKGVELGKIKTEKNFCLVLGNETRGVSEEIQKKCDEFLNIEIDPRIESLNVATSASIIFYELSDF